MVLIFTFAACAGYLGISVQKTGEKEWEKIGIGGHADCCVKIPRPKKAN